MRSSGPHPKFVMGSCSAWMRYSGVNDEEEVEVGKDKEAGEGDKGGEGGAVVEFVDAFIAASIGFVCLSRGLGRMR